MINLNSRNPGEFLFRIIKAIGAFLLTTHCFLDGASLPEGFEETLIVEGINAGATITILPDGRVLYAEQTGLLRAVVDGELIPEPVLDLSARVDTYWERGLIGITYDPDFPRSPFLYVMYVSKVPYVHHVISRFTLTGNWIDPKSERILIEGDDQATLGGGKTAGHQGGPIRFGPDGKLYFGIGEHTNKPAAQSLATFQGKILRINRDGSIPPNNPFYEETTGKYRAIYALGIRNPYGLEFEPETGRLFEADVGQSAFEEVNEILPGGNYGWPHAEGFSEMEGYTNPIHAFGRAVGQSICGAVFYPESGNYPETWHGKLFFVDWGSHWVKAMDVDEPEKLMDFGKGFDAPVWIEAHPDGSLWVLNRGTRWRDGNLFKENAGSLVRIAYLGNGKGAPKEKPFPETLSEVVSIGGLESKTSSGGFIEFRMNAPVWNPGVSLRSWMRIPNRKRIQFSKHNDWLFPEGAVIVQHYKSVSGVPHETHVYWSRGDGTYRAAAYSWKAEALDAFLVKTPSLVSVLGSDAIKWFSPGPDTALDPKLALVGFVPQFNTRQLNHGSQLKDWSQLGIVERRFREAELEDMPQLASLNDSQASVEMKVLSYLDANCAMCHQPGGASRGIFDARFSVQLNDKRLINGEPVAGDLEISGAKLVVPGVPERSVLYERFLREDAFRMPPTLFHGEKSPVIPLVEEWIRNMDK